MAEGNRAVFLAASPVARDTLEPRRANVECVELPYNYEHLYALARQAARRKGQTRGDEALGNERSPSAGGVNDSVSLPLPAILAAADVAELPVMHYVAAMAESTGRRSLLPVVCAPMRQ